MMFPTSAISEEPMKNQRRPNTKPFVSIGTSQESFRTQTVTQSPNKRESYCETESPRKCNPSYSWRSSKGLIDESESVSW